MLWPVRHYKGVLQNGRQEIKINCKRFSFEFSAGLVEINHHHHHLQRLSLLSRSVFKYEATFFLAILDYVFVSVDNIKVAWEFFLMASFVDISANYSSLYLFAQLPFSSYDFCCSFACPIE
jgi:hypothetical protein